MDFTKDALQVIKVSSLKETVKRAESKAIKAGLADVVTALKAMGYIDITGIKLKRRPESKKNPNGYMEIRIFSVLLNKMCAVDIHEVFFAIKSAGFPISGVYAKAMVEDSSDSSAYNKIRIPGVLAHYR